MPSRTGSSSTPVVRLYNRADESWAALSVIVRAACVEALFPGSPALHERGRLAVAAKAPAPPTDRVTLTLPVLNGASRVALNVKGSEKSQAVRHELHPQGGEGATARRPGAPVQWHPDLAGHP